MIPLYNAEQIRNIDTIAINELRIPGILLMENASLNIYYEILDYFTDLSPNDLFGIICGKGNNGGDGFALARHLHVNGFPVKVLYLADENDISDDAATNLIALKKLAEKSNALELKKYATIDDVSFIAECTYIVDAILGTGTFGSLKEPLKSIVAAVNEFQASKIAVDMPSGLNADTGYGKEMFHADLTVTLAGLKKGLFFADGAANAGEVELGSIGLPDNVEQKISTNIFLIEPDDAFFGLPIKENDSHKYSSGKVLNIAGSFEYPGAALLTTYSALKVGAGASVLAFPQSIRHLANQFYPDLVIKTYEDQKNGVLMKSAIDELEERISWADVITIGPGIGRADETIQAVRSLITKRSESHLIIDADGLFALSDNFWKELDLQNCVLTPHTGEFSRLINVPSDEIQKDYEKYGSAFAKESGAYLILKSHRSMIFTPSGEMFINSTGNAGMAKFGSGDVLTGVLAGLLAQSASLEDALISGLYIHSLAGDILKLEMTEYGFTSTDLMNNLPQAIRFLYENIT